MIASIVRHEEILPGYFHMVLDAGEIAAQALPGRFVMIRQSEPTTDPFLRRPLSIMNAHPDGTLEILYKIAGRGTRLLSRRQPGDSLDITGPFGNGFSKPAGNRPAVLIGGGIGIPPLYFLAHHLRHSGNVSVILGGRTRNDLPLESAFRNLGHSVTITTDDGSHGRKGVATDPLREMIESMQDVPPVLYACGPDPMLRAVAETGDRAGCETWLSLEEHMACGIGACLGCVVDTRHGKQRVCRDGPVFSSRDLLKWT